jgi:hypothetical protein
MSEGMSPQVVVRVASVKGLAVGILKKYPKGKISIECELNGLKVETLSSSIGGPIKANEVRILSIFSAIGCSTC